MKYETTLSATATLNEALGERADGDWLAAIEIAGKSGEIYKYIIAYPSDYDEFEATDEALRAWLCDDENSPVMFYESMTEAEAI